MFLSILFSLKWYSLVWAIHYCIYQVISPYDLFLNESVFITSNSFLLLAMVNILTISRAGWKIAVWINKWTIDASINEQILQNMMDSATGWILQQFSWMLQWINECCNKLVLLLYFLFYQLILSLTYSQYNFSV